MSRSRWAPCGAKWRRALPVVEVRRGETQHGVRGVGGMDAGWPAAPARPPLPPGRTASSAVGTSTPTDWRPPPEPLEDRYCRRSVSRKPARRA
jgi:hypothetical protein